MTEAPAEIWDDYRPTGLIELPGLAHQANVARVHVKMECERPLGNFKVLGGMVAGLRALARAAGVVTLRELWSTGISRESLPRLICASDGNHGLAVAAAANRAGSRASIYLPAGVSRFRADRIEALGGEIIQVSGTYDDAVLKAAASTSVGSITSQQHIYRLLPQRFRPEVSGFLSMAIHNHEQSVYEQGM